MTSAKVAQEDKEAQAARRKGPRPGLWLAVALVFAAQVGLLFWLGNPPPIKRAEPPIAPEIRVDANGSKELLALQDPTMFVLPHRENFSGPAWLKIQPLEFTPTNWDEPMRPLPLPGEKLGATFAKFPLPPPCMCKAIWRNCAC
jgi:hypothetical protein